MILAPEPCNTVHKTGIKAIKGFISETAQFPHHPSIEEEAFTWRRW